jgi:hypothetical protein
VIAKPGVHDDLFPVCENDTAAAVYAMEVRPPGRFKHLGLDEMRKRVMATNATNMGGVGPIYEESSVSNCIATTVMPSTNMTIIRPQPGNRPSHMVVDTGMESSYGGGGTLRDGRRPDDDCDHRDIKRIRGNGHRGERTIEAQRELLPPGVALSRVPAEM